FIDTYGYSLEEYQAKCANVIVCSGHKDILTKCIEEKVSVDYSNSSVNKYGKTLWVQTSVTPVLDSNNEIKKIIFIESDITQLKKIENEIEESNVKLFKQKEEILSQKDLLQEKNNLILSYNNAVRDSISYSLQIQKSILPPKEIINNKFDNFIIFKPKDIVSGDFYWFYESEKYFFYAIADCTGHGVPGAFMSIIGVRIFNEIVKDKKCFDPARILLKLHDEFFSSLNQKQNFSYEGMDILIVRLDKNSSENMNVSYAGAKRPFIYFDANKKKVFSLKTARRSVGGIQSIYNKEVFEIKNITIPKGSMIYLTSDGFIDQHNDQRKRIGSARLFEIINEIGLKSEAEQFQYFAKYFEKYKENQYQTDDVLIWGIRV
ncbi:MAG: SpoIIE family protein phosphatase, partial [Bacteroidota bacterium]|nr:SpoIIE family protein phosphatase [Bacteroidota bacterium]